MITDFFNTPFQNSKDRRVELQEIQEQTPTNKNKSFLGGNTEAQKLRAQKLSSLPHQIQSIIQALLSSDYQEELQSLRDAEYLRVKNTKDTFFGETIIEQTSAKFFKQTSKVAQGLCQIFFERGSYMVGYFQSGRLQGEFIHVLENGSYIKAKPRIKQSKRSVSGFITDDSDSLASDNDSQEEDRIQESEIHVEIGDQRTIDIFSNMQCQISFNGIYYKGSLKKGQLNGFVLEKGKDYQFQGFFVNGERKRGKMVSIYGFQYQGTFRSNKFDGLGTLKTQDGVYSGQFKNGLKDGEGQFNWIDGSSYKGDFRKDLRHGKGFFRSKQGSFKGDWRNDEIEGSGYLVIGNQGVGGQWTKNQYSRPNKFF